MAQLGVQAGTAVGQVLADDGVVGDEVVADRESGRFLTDRLTLTGLKLEALAPQLVNLDPREPAAAEVRKLLATELPELIDGYTRVPAGLRSDDRNGVAPDKQLVEALGVVDSELARMSADLATGDLNKLATQGRYLELKYKDDQSL